MIVSFHNVGRGKASWKAECSELDYDWFYSQVKRNSDVMSSDLEFCLKENDEKSGVIFAGFHNIGTFTIE